MCGIAGFTGPNNNAVLEAFQRRLHHRGPDQQGAWSQPEMCLSSNRLAIIDLAGGRQPIFNEDRTCCIVCNGEIYNYRELRAELQSRHRFTTASDTEVILHVYEEQGIDTPLKLRGDFAFCIWDGRTQQCFLSRDPLGVKPLFYTTTGTGDLVFGSELRALLQHPGVSAELDLQAVTEFLACLYIAAPRSLVRSVRKLLPGESLVWRRGMLRTWRYWRPPAVQEIAPRPGEFEERARALLQIAVRRRLIADVPVGAFLSGGLDSSLIVALASRESPGLRTFSIGYGEEDFDELTFARQVSRHYGTDHHEFVVRPDARQLLEEVIDAMDEPIADSSAIPTFLVARETRAFVKVALSGVGGDELFAGYPRYLGAKLSERIPPLLARCISRCSEHFGSRPTSRDVSGWIRRFGRGLVLTPPERYREWTTFLTQQQLNALLKHHAVGGVPFKEPAGPTAGTPLRYLDWILRVDLEGYLPSNLLHFGDTMTMANSLELRVPFCDVDLVEAVACTPASIRFPGYRLKAVLRNMARDYLPPVIVHRKKQGFMIPIGRWFRKELASYMGEQLNERDIPNFLNVHAVRHMLREHTAARENHTHALWAVLVLSRWLARHPEVRYETTGGCP